MIIARQTHALIVACLVALAPACAKKKSSDSSSGKDEEEEVEPDDTEDGETDTDTKVDTDPCAASLVDDNESTDPCDGGDDVDPEAEFYEQFVTPPEMKDCNEQGFVFLRCTGTCSEIKSPAKFKCDRAGIEGIFSTVEGAKEDLANYLDNKKYFIDQCGVTAASKPFVALACFTKGDGECVPKEELDSKEATAEVHFLSTDPATADLCP